jgi:hypothetical protein
MASSLVTFSKRFAASHAKRPVEGRVFGDHGTTFYGIGKSMASAATIKGRVLFDVRTEERDGFITQALAIEPDAASLSSFSAGYECALASIMTLLGLEHETSDPYFYPEQLTARFKIRVDENGKPTGGDKDLKVYDGGASEMAVADLKVGDQVTIRLAFDSICSYVPSVDNDDDKTFAKIVVRITRISVPGSGTNKENVPPPPSKKQKASKK